MPSERDPVTYALRFGVRSRGLEVPVHEVVADPRQVRERLGQLHQRAAPPATDVGHVETRLQPIPQVGRSGNPLLEQEVLEPGAGESLHAVPPVAVIVGDGKTATVLEPALELLQHGPDGRHLLVQACEEEGARLVGERLRVLDRQREHLRAGVVVEILRAGHPREPLPDIALVQPCSLREGRARRRTSGESLEQAQSIAEVRHGQHHGAFDVGHGGVQEALAFFGIDRERGSIERSHRGSSSGFVIAGRVVAPRHRLQDGVRPPIRSEADEPRPVHSCHGAHMERDAGVRDRRGDGDLRRGSGPPIHVSLVAVPEVMIGTLTGLYDVFRCFGALGWFDSGARRSPAVRGGDRRPRAGSAANGQRAAGRELACPG